MTMMTRRARYLAGVVATAATVLLVGGSLGLAEHYAQAGAGARVEAGSLAHHAVRADGRNS
jgi:hypothetical protein